MTLDDIEHFEAAAGDLLDELGYPPRRARRSAREVGERNKDPSRLHSGGPHARDAHYRSNSPARKHPKRRRVRVPSEYEPTCEALIKDTFFKRQTQSKCSPTGDQGRILRLGLQESVQYT
jgi:hypothetical protein